MTTLQEALEAEAAALGAGAATCSPDMVEVLGNTDLDFVWLDLEHGGISHTDSLALTNLTRAADVADIDLLVRIAGKDPSVIRKVLDAGVRNVVVPRVKTADEVRRAVEAGRFSYESTPGERGVGLGRANVWGGESVGPGYREREDEEVSIGVNIETEEAIENLEDILAVSDLGFVLLGHQDLSASMGVPHPQVPSVKDAIDTFRETSKEAGMPVGRSVGLDASGVETAIDEGYDFLLVGNEFAASRQAFSELTERVGE